MLTHCIFVLLSIQLVTFGAKKYVIAETDYNFLQGFYTRSLLRSDKSPNVLEIEETYDNFRGLGKLALHSARNGPSVLLSRSNSPLYLDVQYSLSGTVIGCMASSTERTGGFHLFNHIQEIWPQVKEQSHLIGPASLLYLYRNELLNYKQGLSEPSNISDVSQRLILDPRTIYIHPHLLFKRTGFTINRAPLLIQLAAYLEFEVQDEKYFVDFLDIQQFDVSRDESSDVFKIPILCNHETINDVFKSPNSFKLEAIGSSVELTHNWQDIPRAQPQNHLLVLDSERNLLQFEVEDRWLNVIDLKRSLLFHKSSEQSPVVQYETDVLAIDKRQSQLVRNSECSILTTEELTIYKSLATVGSISARLLAFYTGNYKSNVYLGIESNYRGRGRAHELELYYEKWQDLPAPIRLLEPPFSKNFDSPVVGKLSFAAVDICRDLFIKPINCRNPILLGFEVHSFDRKLIGSVVYNNFQWHTSETQISSLNLDTCPLEKLKLLLEISSSKEFLESAELDKAVLDRMLEYLKPSIVSGLMLVSFQRVVTTNSFLRASYSIELAEAPEESVKYDKNIKQIKKLDIDLIDGLSDVETSQECLAWASQYGQSRAVLYSKKDADCLVYKSQMSEILHPINYSVGSYEIFSRKLHPLPKNGAPIKLFLREELDKINTMMKVDNKDPNLEFKFLNLQIYEEDRAANSSFTKETTLAVSKTKFVGVKQESVPSFRDCSSSCQNSLNCTYFSYCMDENLDQLCQLNDVFNLSDAKRLTTDYNCEIHAKNYLHYFRHPPQPDPSNNKHQWRLLSDELFKLNPQECAKACYSKESCSRFFYCPNEGCFLWDATNEVSAVLEDPSRCDSYTRRPLSFFRATQFRELDAFSWTGSQLHIAHLSRYQNAEECAQTCITDSECASFDVCHVVQNPKTSSDANPETTEQHLVCILLSGSIFHEPPMLELSTSNRADNQTNNDDTSNEGEWRTFGCRHYEHSSVAISLNSPINSNKNQNLVRTLTLYSVISFYFVNFFIASSLGILAGVILPNFNDYLKQY